MGRKKILIPKDDLYKLYIVENLSPAKIGEKYNCDAITVRTRLKEAGISLKTKSHSQTRYAKNDFNGTDTEKAYMLGFRYGDLNVYKVSPVSETLVVRSHTTQIAQENTFNNIFESYGTITISRNENHIYSACYLNLSFLFLLDKYNTQIQIWIKESSERMWAFAAGYIDAEGTFGINQGRGRFKIDAYDVMILEDLHEFFLNMQLRSLFRKLASKDESKYGTIWNKDLWRLEINEANSLESLISNLSPYMNHSDRISHARNVQANIMQRREYGSIK